MTIHRAPAAPARTAALRTAPGGSSGTTLVATVAGFVLSLTIVLGLIFVLVSAEMPDDPVGPVPVPSPGPAPHPMP